MYWVTPNKLLTIELIPNTAWGQNLRAVLSQRDWDTIRKWSYRAASYHCEICGESGKDQGYAHAVECHEKWEWFVNNLTGQAMQVLVGVITLCPECHKVKHFGRTVAVSPDPEQTTNALLARIQRINNWTMSQVFDHKAAAFDEWEQRNNYTWELDVDSWLHAALDMGLFTLPDFIHFTSEKGGQHDPEPELTITDFSW